MDSIVSLMFSHRVFASFSILLLLPLFCLLQMLRLAIRRTILFAAFQNWIVRWLSASSVPFDKNLHLWLDHKARTTIFLSLKRFLQFNLKKNKSKAIRTVELVAPLMTLKKKPVKVCFYEFSNPFGFRFVCFFIKKMFMTRKNTVLIGWLVRLGWGKIPNFYRYIYFESHFDKKISTETSNEYIKCLKYFRKCYIIYAPKNWFHIKRCAHSLYRTQFYMFTEVRTYVFWINRTLMKKGKKRVELTWNLRSTENRLASSFACESLKRHKKYYCMPKSTNSFSSVVRCSFFVAFALLCAFLFDLGEFEWNPLKNKNRNPFDLRVYVVREPTR